ncbi:hypothetical protein CAEBREN_05497 [Caenorhabditis brenneri]|uniref:Uncharacterized protein n=1 Tax=Caenorhabditis brenneri TaxID=135651 RepID=G0MVC2_CAEBE|nr:hypothetical protein CAEBREN_05497 [Caenorhabditis brenneri]
MNIRATIFKNLRCFKNTIINFIIKAGVQKYAPTIEQNKKISAASRLQSSCSTRAG